MHHTTALPPVEAGVTGRVIVGLIVVSLLVEAALDYPTKRALRGRLRRLVLVLLVFREFSVHNYSNHCPRGRFPVRFLLLFLFLATQGATQGATEGATGWATARAEEVTPLPGLVRESLTLQGPHGRLEALVVRPDAPGRFPLALITHGMPRDETQMPAMAPEVLLNPAVAFAQRGYASVVVMRTYYGRSEGAFQEAWGPAPTGITRGPAGQGRPM